MRNTIVLFLGSMLIGFILACTCFWIWDKDQNKKIKSEATREAIHAIRQHIYDQTNIKYDLLNIDDMSDDQLLDFTARRSVEYAKRFDAASQPPADP